MHTEVAWVLVSSGTQVQSQIIPDPDYLTDYLSVSYDYVIIHFWDKPYQEINFKCHLNSVSLSK